MKKSLFATALLIGAMVGSQAYAKELATCKMTGDSLTLMTEITCQDSTKPLDKDGNSPYYKTTLYKLYKNGWKIVETRNLLTWDWSDYREAYYHHVGWVYVYLEK